MSLCDTCHTPGRCCRVFHLKTTSGSYGEGETMLEVMSKLAMWGFPFMPLFKLRSTGQWRFWCPNLDLKTGRCNDYENRPKLCAEYAPGQDDLCVYGPLGRSSDTS
jgi:Fe-S-cluster containining protein